MTAKDVVKAETTVIVQKGGLVQANVPAPQDWVQDYGLQTADKYRQKLADGPSEGYIYYTPSTVADCLKVLGEDRLMAVIAVGWRTLRQNTATNYVKGAPAKSIDLGMTWVPYPEGITPGVSKAKAKDQLITALQAQIAELTAKLSCVTTAEQ